MSADTLAKAEAAFAVELASSVALQSLCAAAPREVVEMTWKLGYITGRRDAFSDAREMIG